MPFAFALSRPADVRVLIIDTDKDLAEQIGVGVAEFGVDALVPSAQVDELRGRRRSLSNAIDRAV
jgi:hypothetical protein